jgi:hypothetical protein
MSFFDIRLVVTPVVSHCMSFFDIRQRRTDKTMVKMKNDKRTNNDLERTTEKTKDYLTLSVYFMVADLALSVD